MKSLGTSTIDARVFEKKKQPSPKKNVRPEKNLPKKKRIVLECQTRKEKKKKPKNRALITEKKGKIEIDWLGFFFFFFFSC